MKSKIYCIIEESLHSRAVMYGFEHLGWEKDSTIRVSSEGVNVDIKRMYENVECATRTQVEIRHCWLPECLALESCVDDKPIPFCRQHMTGMELDYVKEVIDGGLDSASKFTIQCSSYIKDILGKDCEQVVMVPSGTAALEIAALLCNIGLGDEVIMPSYTFSSTANAVVLRGAVPVFVDCVEDTACIDVSRIESAITKKTKVICVVHYAGIACDMDVVMDIASRHHLYVVEDNAQGFLSKYKGRYLGTFGDIGCFSFHYTKNIVCGEGGCVSINRHTELARRSVLLWEKGTNRYDFVNGKVDKYEWMDVGSSYVPNEVSCAILFAQLLRCHQITALRVARFQFYMKELKLLEDRKLVRLPKVPEGCDVNGHIFFMLLNSIESKKNCGTRDERTWNSCILALFTIAFLPSGNSLRSSGFRK